MKKLLLALSLFVATTTANAAEFIHETTDIGNEYIIIRGEIVTGDGEKFTNLISKYPKTKSIVLNSNGGIVYEGIVIAAEVHDRRMMTFIFNGDVCFSICAPIFFSGKERFIQQDAYLGVHPAKSSKTNQVSVDANALIAWYFGTLGYDLGLVELWISADPDKLNYITAQINRDLNLGIQTID